MCKCGSKDVVELISKEHQHLECRSCGHTVTYRIEKDGKKTLIEKDGKGAC